MLAPPCMHYSFDFADFPSSQQPGQEFFPVCEATSTQVNYLIDEANSVGKGSNTIISLVDNYLKHHGKQEMI